MSSVNATPTVVAAAVQSGKTTVAAALADALSDPKRFNGRRVIEREAAVYDHPSPVVKKAATSKLVDRVLLDDESETYQCRTCGSTWQTAQSAVSHATSHSRSPEVRAAAAGKAGAAAQAKRVAARSDVAAVNDATRRAVSAAATTQTPPKTRTTKTVIKADVHEIVTNLRALAVQQRRTSESLDAIASEILNLGKKLEDKPEVAPEELAELRAKATQLDTLKQLLGQ